MLVTVLVGLGISIAGNWIRAMIPEPSKRWPRWAAPVAGVTLIAVAFGYDYARAPHSTVPELTSTFHPAPPRAEDAGGTGSPFVMGPNVAIVESVVRGGKGGIVQTDVHNVNSIIDSEGPVIQTSVQNVGGFIKTGRAARDGGTERTVPDTLLSPNNH
jgi:hypothetical protein